MLIEEDAVDVLRLNMRRFYKHQQDAFQYALKEKHPALFLDMRLGKTLIVIRRVKLYNLKEPKILVVAPNSAMDSWQDDLKKEDENFGLFNYGTIQERMERLCKAYHKWYLFNKEFSRHLPQLAVLPWDVIILDESAVIIKNSKAQVTKYFLKYFKAVKHRFVLTGTPNPESDLEFIPQLLFVHRDVGGCSNYWDFRATYCKPVDALGYKWGLTTEGKEVLQKHLDRRCFILSRKEAGYFTESIVEDRYVDFSPEMQEHYNKIENEFALTINSKETTTIWKLTQFSWLRQLCGGFFQNELLWDGKIKELINTITGELKREQIIIWFVYKAEMKAVFKELNALKEKVFKMDGSTPITIRGSYRKELQNGNIRIGLIQNEVGQMGMNLSSADTAIYFSEPTSALVRRQTEDRIVDINKKTTLLYLNMIVKNTVEQDIRKAKKEKNLRSSLSLSKAVIKQFLKRKEAECTTL